MPEPPNTRTPVICKSIGCGNRPVALIPGEGPVCSVDLVLALSDNPKLKLEPIPSPRLRIDPSVTLTPADVEAELMNLLVRQDEGVTFMEAHEQRLSELSVDYDLAFAAAYGQADEAVGARTDKARESYALTQVKSLYVQRRAEELVIRTTKERLKAIRYEIEVFRSLGASVRSSFENANYGAQGPQSGQSRYGPGPYSRHDFPPPGSGPDDDPYAGRDF